MLDALYVWRLVAGVMSLCVVVIELITESCLEVEAMKRSLRAVLGCLFLILCAAIPYVAKEWRGIVPLHSTRADVIKLLGEPKHFQADSRDYFILEAETVTFKWIDPSCVRKYPAEPDSQVRPSDLVLSISVFLKTPLPDDGLHPVPKKLYAMSCIEERGCTYIDDEEGYSFATSEDGIIAMTYSSTAEEYKVWMQGHEACRSIGRRVYGW